jgi:hypothetical protein
MDGLVDRGDDLAEGRVDAAGLRHQLRRAGRVESRREPGPRRRPVDLLGRRVEVGRQRVVHGGEIAERFAQRAGPVEVSAVGRCSGVDKAVVAEPRGECGRVGQVVLVVLDVERVDERLHLGQGAWGGRAAARFRHGYSVRRIQPYHRLVDAGKVVSVPR